MHRHWKYYFLLDIHLKISNESMLEKQHVLMESLINRAVKSMK